MKLRPHNVGVFFLPTFLYIYVLIFLNTDMKFKPTWLLTLFITIITISACSKSEVLSIVTYDDNYGTQTANTVVANIGTANFVSEKAPLLNDTTSEYGTGAFLVNNGKSLLIVGIADFLGSYQRIQMLVNLKTGTDIRGEYPIEITESSQLNGFRNYGVWGLSAVQLTYPNPIGIVGFTSTGKVTITNRVNGTVNGRFEFVQGYAGVRTNITKGTFYKLKIN